jgi:flavodoxin
MRKIRITIAAVLAGVMLAGCSNGSVQAGSVSSPAQYASVSSAESSASASASRILVAYFSQAGEQYNVGVVEKGNTQIVAEMIAEETGADLFHIERKEAYPEKLSELLPVAQDEQKNSARPELSADVEGWDQYDTVFLGYPIWWGDMPMPVYTFLESHDFSGKTVIPFDTNGGSGLADTVDAIAKACSGAAVQDGLAITGTDAQNNQDKVKGEVQDFLKGLGY